MHQYGKHAHVGQEGHFFLGVLQALDIEGRVYPAATTRLSLDTLRFLLVPTGSFSSGDTKFTTSTRGAGGVLGTATI